MPETPFTGLIRSLRAASNPWERLRLIASGARTLGALPQRQRRALVRNLGLAGAEDLVDRLAGDDEEVVAAFRGALDRIEEDPGSLERLVARLRDPKTRKETLLGLFGHLEGAVQEEVREEGEDPETGGRETGSPDTQRGDQEEQTTEPEEAEVPAEVEAETEGEIEAERAAEAEAREAPGVVDRSPRPPERPARGVENEIPVPAPPPPDEAPAQEEAFPSNRVSRLSATPAARPRAERSRDLEGRGEIPEEELHTDRPEGPSDQPLEGRIATATAPADGLRAAPGASSAPVRRETPSSPGVSFGRALPTLEQPPGRSSGAKRTELLRRLRSFRKDLEAGDSTPKSLAARLERIPAGWPRRRALEAAIRARTTPGLAATLGLMKALLRPSDRIWCLTALAEAQARTDDDWNRLLAAAPDPATRRRLELRRSASARRTDER